MIFQLWNFLSDSWLPTVSEGGNYLDSIRYNTEMIVEAALDTMEITDLANRQVGELSENQQQRVMLARTLVQDVNLLMVEPLIHADITTQELFFHSLERLKVLLKANFHVLLRKCSANTKKGRPGNDSIR